MTVTPGRVDGLRRGMVPDAARMVIQRLAWAGIRVDVGDTTVFIDASHQWVENGGPDAAVSTDAARRFALITHHHGDHFSPAALRGALGGNGTLLVPAPVLPHIDARGFHVRSAELHAPVSLPDLPSFEPLLTATAVPAADGLGHPQASWILQAGGARIIHCGDTLWHGGLWSIGSAYGPFDLAFLPINGFRLDAGQYAKSDVPMAMTPELAAAAAVVLGAKAVVPIHYGANAPSWYVEAHDPLASFTAAAAARNMPVKPLKVGETIAV